MVSSIRFTVRILICLAIIISGLSSCNKTQKINNKYISATFPKEYHDITNNKNNDILYLVKFEHFNNKDDKGGLQSILSIDNIKDVLFQPNSQTIKESTPKEILENRLKSIEEDTQNPNYGWKNFKIINPPREVSFKNYPAAEAVFTVEETYQDKIITRKIKRMVVFVKNDLWNIVLAPTQSSIYDEEMKVFENILNSLEVK